MASSSPQSNDRTFQTFAAVNSVNKFTDQGEMKQEAARAEERLNTICVCAEPKQVDLNVVLVYPWHRFGDTPNVQHTHYGILAAFLKSSYDRTRPAVGICVEYKFSAGIEKLF